MTKEQFIGTTENWDNYKPFLWQALEATSGRVIEMGCGNGSTKQLHFYCIDSDRLLYSYENNFEWYKKFKNLASDKHFIEWIDNDWDYVQFHDNIGVLFIDNAPGERRKTDIALYANKAQILVIHDTEPESDHGYQMRSEINKLKYIKDDKVLNGAWTTMCSNFIDVNNL